MAEIITSFPRHLITHGSLISGVWTGLVFLGAQSLRVSEQSFMSRTERVFYLSDNKVTTKNSYEVFAVEITMVFAGWRNRLCLSLDCAISKDHCNFTAKLIIKVER